MGKAKRTLQFFLLFFGISAYGDLSWGMNDDLFKDQNKSLSSMRKPLNRGNKEMDEKKIIPSESMGLARLPKDILAYITTFLEPADLCILRKTGSLFRKVIPTPISQLTDTQDHVQLYYNPEILGAYLRHALNLTHLDLFYFYKIENPNLIHASLHSLTRLIQLSLPRYAKGPADAAFLVPWIQSNTTLQELVIPQQGLHLMRKKLIKDALGQLTSLRKLTIGKLTDEEAKLLVQVLPHLYSLEVLKLPWSGINEVNGKDLIFALTLHNNIVELDLSSISLSTEWSGITASSLPELKHLRKLKIHVSKGNASALAMDLPRISSLRQLSLSLGSPDDGSALFPALANITGLEEIKISSYGDVFPKSSSLLALALPHIQQLLDLRALSLNYKHQDNDDQRLACMIKSLTRLQKLKIKPSNKDIDINVLETSLVNLHLLRELEISGIGDISKGKATCLATILAPLSFLKKLNLGVISEKGMRELVPTFEQLFSLEELHFVCRRDLLSFALILRHSLSLKKLYTSTNFLTLEDFTKFKNMILPFAKNLRVSNLSEIYWEGFNSKDHPTQENQILQELSESFLYFPSLRKIHLPQYGITAEGRRTLRRALLPKIEVHYFRVTTSLFLKKFKEY